MSIRVPAPRDAWIDRLHSLLGLPPSPGNRVRVLRNGDEIFPAMLAAVDAAEDTIDFVTFVYWQGDIAVDVARALSRAAQRGVQVRVLLDALGAAPVLPDADAPTIAAYKESLRAARAALGAAYGFNAANLGDDAGENGW